MVSSIGVELHSWTERHRSRVEMKSVKWIEKTEGRSQPVLLEWARVGLFHS